MKRRLWVTLLAAILALGLWIASVRDPFLDRAISLPPESTSPIYLDQLEAIAPVIGKKVILPPGLVDYLSKEKLNCPWHYGSGTSEDRKSTIRDYLNQRQGFTGLHWKYDAAQDAVIFDFAWRQSVSHPARELVNQLGKLSPTPLKNWATTPAWLLDLWDFALNLKPSREGTPSSWPLDPWRVAMNELMNEPDNFPHAWKVRLEDGCSAFGSFANFDLFGDDGVFAHILKDNDGQEHLLILHHHPPMTTKSRGTFAYYLFAADGTWEDGGIFEGGGPYCPPTILFGSERAIIEINFQPLKITDTTGKVTTIDSGLHVGDYLDDVLEINHGKLAASISTNVSPLPDPLDETLGVTPLRHLGD